jgi:hypothetical protein
LYLVKRIQSILILADEDLIWYGICRSLLESFFIVVDDCAMDILDCSLDLQTHSKYCVVSNVQQVNALFSIDPLICAHKYVFRGEQKLEVNN